MPHNDDDDDDGDEDDDDNDDDDNGRGGDGRRRRQRHDKMTCPEESCLDTDIYRLTVVELTGMQELQ